MKPTDKPLQKAMRRSRGNAGSRRSDSTHMLTEVKWVGSSRSRSRVPCPRSIGSSATTMGNSRTPLRLTAIATSIGAAPVPSAETRMTCAGPAHTNTVDNASHQALRPKSCASAPMPT